MQLSKNGSGSRLLKLGVVLVLLLAACSGGQPRISAETAQFSFGEVVNGNIVSETVAISNTGNSPLVIDAVSTSCGCTQASLDAMRIEPGASAQLTIQFDSGAHGPDANGEITRQVFIASNDPDQPELMIEFDATVLPAD
jgi:hypothetical protein